MTWQSDFRETIRLLPSQPLERPNQQTTCGPSKPRVKTVFRPNLGQACVRYSIRAPIRPRDFPPSVDFTATILAPLDRNRARKHIVIFDVFRKRVDRAGEIHKIGGENRNVGMILEEKLELSSSLSRKTTGFSTKICRQPDATSFSMFEA